MHLNKTPQLTNNLLKYEYAFWNNGIEYIAGVDEVGRGALAGPLVVGAVILNREHLQEGQDITCPDSYIEKYKQINDSKLIAPKKRDKLAQFIKEQAIDYTIEMVPAQIIDSVGIAQATQIAFFNAIQNLKIKANHVITDAFEIKKLTTQHQTNVKRGDRLSMTVAAASIIAKVARDELMIRMHTKYQQYGFDRHKGYGTKMHKQALRDYGYCEIHRKCFEPIKSMIITQSGITSL